MSVINYDNGISVPGKIIKSKSWLLLFILFAIVFGLVVYYFREIKKEVRLLEKINAYWLFIAVVAQFLTYLFTAVIYRLLLNTQKIQRLPELWEILKASVISLFFNQTMPSAGISGNTFFFNFLSKLNVKVSQIIFIIIAELLIFYIAIEFIIIMLLAGCIYFSNTPPAFTVILLAGLAIYFVFALLIILTGRNKTINFLLKKIQRTKLLRKLLRSLIQKFQEQDLSENNVQLLPLLKSKRRILIKSFLVQLLIILADGFTLYALFYGLGMPVSPFVVLLSLLSTKIISIIPFLPGALVLYESSMSYLFSILHVPLGAAIIVTLVYRLLSFWFPMPIGLFLYRRWIKDTETQPTRQ